MKAGIFFTGTGPILILTTYASLDDSKLIEKLTQKGIKKYIAYEVSEELVKQRYGKHVVKTLRTSLYKLTINIKTYIYIYMYEIYINIFVYICIYI